jgi:uncharacterized iron-regulated protein
MSLRTVALALACSSAACAPRVDPRLVAQPISERTWASVRHQDHPLVGKIWDPRAGTFVDEGALVAALVDADLILLGEVHDNVDHHLLQARLLRAVLAAGRRPALAFEMLTTDQQAAIDAALARAPRDPDAFAKAVGWDRSGWPKFALYRPIFAAGLEAGLPVVAANLPRSQVRELVREGAAALDEPMRVRLAADEPLADHVMEELRAEMREVHCDALPEPMLDPLVLAQRARDARMSERLATAGEGGGAVLIAGSGHVRTDRGVPAYLAKDAPGRSVVSVAFLEVSAKAREPAGYADARLGGALPFHFVVFTPGTERQDPCEGLRARAGGRTATAPADPPLAAPEGTAAGRAD